MNSKTPVMVLQEYAVKRAFRAPEYNLIYAVQGTHDNEFHFQVTLGSVRAIGIGRSKQIAKHDAALKALELLSEQDAENFDSTDYNSKQAAPDTTASPIKAPVNAIGTLCDLCVENKIPPPFFTPISEVGPPHLKEFTFECKISSIVTRATAGTKKQAKHIAAKYMLDRITSVLPDLVAECNLVPNESCIMDSDQTKEARAEYNKYKYSKPKPNLSLKIEDYPNQLKHLIESKDINTDDIIKIIQQEPTEESLKQILDILELEYKIETLQNTCITVLSINTEVPLCILHSDGENAAVEKLISKAFEYFEILIL